MRIMCWIQKQNGENGYPVGGVHSKNATGGVDGFGYPYLTPPFFIEGYRGGVEGRRRDVETKLG